VCLSGDEDSGGKKECADHLGPPHVVQHQQAVLQLGAQQQLPRDNGQTHSKTDNHTNSQSQHPDQQSAQQSNKDRQSYSLIPTVRSTARPTVRATVRPTAEQQLGKRPEQLSVPVQQSDYQQSNRTVRLNNQINVRP
jgi:hypothetical protein